MTGKKQNSLISYFQKKWRQGSFFVFSMLNITPLFAQYGIDTTYNFCPDTIYSAFNNCYGDSNRFYTAGVTSTMGVSNLHVFLTGSDYSGKILWTKNLLFPPNDNAVSSYNGITKMGNNYAFIGTMIDYNIYPGYNTWYPFIYVFNKDGDSILFKSYPDTVKTRYFSAILYDRNAIITAGTWMYSGTTAAVWICKFDTAGNLLWDKKLMKLTGATNPKIGKIVLSSDSMHYVICGQMPDTTIGSGNSSGMICMDTSGNVKWVRSLTKPYFSWNEMDIVSNPTGGFYFVSTYSKSPTTSLPENSALYIGKLNEQGYPIWTIKFQDSFHKCLGRQIAWTPDKRHLIILAGPDEDARTGLMKIDTIGNIKWYRFYQHFYDFNQPWWAQYAHNLRSLSITPDDRYLMAGSTEGGKGPLSWVVLTDSNGCRYPNDPACWPLTISKTEIENEELKVYPNPVTNQLTVEGLKAGTIISISDITGRELFRTISTQAKELIDMHALSAGTYMLQLQSPDGYRMNVKVVKE